MIARSCGRTVAISTTYLVAGFGQDHVQSPDDSYILLSTTSICQSIAAGHPFSERGTLHAAILTKPGTMSTSFSSVVKKPGAGKIVPKGVRRGVQRPTSKPASQPPALTPESSAPSPAPANGTEQEQRNDSIAPDTTPTLQQHPVTPPSTSDIPPESPPSRSRAPPTVVPSTVPIAELNGTRDTEDAGTTQETPERPVLHAELVPSVSDRRPAVVATSTDEHEVEPSPRAGSERKANALVNDQSSTFSDVAAQNKETSRETGGEELAQHASNSTPSGAVLSSNKRKRKQPPHPSASFIARQPTTTDTRTLECEPSQASAHVRERTPRRSQSIDDLLGSATAQAASVREQANAITESTRSLRQRRTPRTSEAHSLETEAEAEEIEAEIEEAEAAEEAEDDELRSRGKKASKKKRPAKTMEEVAAEIVDSIGEGRAGRQRAVTPEDAETREIQTSAIKMGELCKDTRIGKKSKTEKLMQENWAEILARRKEDADIRRKRMIENKNRRYGSKKSKPTDGTAEGSLDGLANPGMVIINGQILVDDASRTVDGAAMAEQAIREVGENVRDDDRIYKYVNQATLGSKHGAPRFKWDDDTTDLFYKGLRMFGTDLMMVASLFPDMTRKQLKAKWLKELKNNEARVNSCLQEREQVDLVQYAERTKAELIDPESIEAEIKAEEARLRRDHNQKLREEGYDVEDDPDIAIPFQEQGQDRPENTDGEAPAGEDGGVDQMEARGGRFDDIADAIVKDATAPRAKKKQTQPRRQKDTGRKRDAKKGRQSMGGVEEMLGSIEEMVS